MKALNIIVACEIFGKVRDAFRRRGHEAWSCDILGPGDVPQAFTDQEFGNYHFKGNIVDYLDCPLAPWDMMIAFPPCTHLAVSGARWFKDKQQEQSDALRFVRKLMDAPIDRIALENPISVISTRIRKPDQIIQPWQFGHGETKATCLWLKNLPKLVPTNIVNGRENRVHREPPAPDRWMKRSKTFEGIAEAMAEQWSNIRPPRQGSLPGIIAQSPVAVTL